MSERTTQSLESRIDEIAEQIRALQFEVRRLSSRVDATDPQTELRQSSNSETEILPEQLQKPPAPADTSVVVLDEDPEEAESWVEQSSLLSEISSLSFLLVAALAIRTVSERGIVDLHLGAAVGMLYAGILLVVGWFRYARGESHAAVIIGAGMGLLFTITLETQARFHSLPTGSAYLLLGATCAVMSMLSYLHQKTLPAAMGIAGAFLVGAILDFPAPPFLGLTILLLVITAAAHRVAAVPNCWWLRWAALAGSFLLFRVWQLRIAYAVQTPEARTASLAMTAFVAMISAYAFLNLAVAFCALFRRSEEDLSAFDLLLSPLIVLWASCELVMLPAAAGGNSSFFAPMGLVAGATYLGATSLLRNRVLLPPSAVTSLTVTAFLLVDFWLLQSFAITEAAVLIAALALTGGVLAIRWENRGILTLSCLIQILVGFSFAGYVVLSHDMAALGAFAASAASAFCGFFSYMLVRRGMPNAKGLRIGLIFSSLVCAFIVLKLAAYRILLNLPTELPNSLACAETIIITAGAAALMIAAYLRKDREVRGISLIVLLGGGAKLFLFDLMNTHGIPLVISMFTFGLAIAVESAVLRRWKKKAARKAAA